MEDQTFKVIFKGKTVRDADPEQAQAHFAKLFKLSPEKAKLFFDGKARVLKKSMPMDKANHFRAVMRKAGIKVSLEKNEIDSETKAAQEWEVSEPGVVIIRPIQPPQTHIETSHIKLSFDLRPLAEKFDFKPEEVNIDHIRIDEDSERPIVEPKEIEVPEFDTDDLTTAEVGAIMVDAQIVETPDIPVDGLELDDSDEPIVKKVKYEEFEVDISGISLQVEE